VKVVGPTSWFDALATEPPEVQQLIRSENKDNVTVEKWRWAAANH
jgi:hypothetical protein